MSNQLNQLLLDKFGYSSFRPGQKEAIQSVLSGQDTLVMLPTGTGKSLCYQLPAYLTDGLILIVSPLLSLMQDQVENLKLMGEKRVVALNSLTPYSERNRIFKRMNQYRYIYTSPEMLQNSEVMNRLKQIKVSLFVVDEAHCISHWGTDFRPDYLSLANVRKQLNNPITMGLTATATAKVREEIIQFLDLDKQKTTQIIQSVDRPEIKLIVEHCKGDKLDKIIHYVKSIQGAGVIYFMSKKLADDVARILRNEYRINAESYHSDIDGDDKIKIQQQFLNNEIQVICATSAFGMGFDKKDIRYVIHYHLPDSPEMYLQEVGRASRDGNLGLGILLYQPGDEQIQRHFIEEAFITKEELMLVAQRGDKIQFSEDYMLKLAKYFLDKHHTVDDAYREISLRKENKLKQVEYMVRYTYNAVCKRKMLLDYFNEKENTTLEICCTHCGLDQTMLYDQLNDLSFVQSEASSTIISWQETFKALYNID